MNLSKPKSRLSALFYFAFIALFSINANASPWDENFFPNTELVNHQGQKVTFFDELIKDKIVAINFIYTSCPDICPLETAQLVKVQNLLKDRIGKDIFLYSISIDPEVDTPQRLAAYRKRFKANWPFFTGNKQDIIKLREKLGLYIDGVDDGPNKNNHNVSMIIGNQKTGRWMKRSPFENPHVLADQLANWLSEWKTAQTGPSYETAPSLRKLDRGEPLFRTRCASCHSITGQHDNDMLGPDLLDISQRRDRQWLFQWIMAPDQMLKAKDPIAMALYQQYNELAMPNMRLNAQEVGDVLYYIEQESLRANANTNANKPSATPLTDNAELISETLATASDNNQESLAIANAWVREAFEGADVNAGYLTMVNISEHDLTLSRITSPDFDKVEMHEMRIQDGQMLMNSLSSEVILAGSTSSFKPAGKHLMLFNANKQLQSGDEVQITLHFANGAQQCVTMQVKR